MATRGRGRRRGAAPVAPMGSHSTRATRGAMRDPEDEKPDIDMDAPQDIDENDGDHVQAVRRGAPPITSPIIPTERPDNSSEIEAVADAGMEMQAAASALLQAPELDMALEEEDETKLAILADGLPDIHQAAERLFAKQKSPDPANPHLGTIMRRRRNAFISIRAEYESSHMPPFIDIKRLQRLDEQTGGQGAAIAILRKANTVSALDLVDQLDENNFGTEKSRKFFSSLRVAFPYTYTMTYAPDMQLRAYTQYLIESLAADSHEPNVLAAVTRIFCAVSPESVQESSIGQLLENGPFISLGGRNDHNVETNMVKAVIGRIQDVVKHHPSPHGAAVALRKEFDTKAYLSELRAFLIREWPMHIPRLGGQEIGADMWRDAMASQEFDDGRSMYSMAESQPVMRPAGSSFAQPLYRGMPPSPAQQAAAESLARVREVTGEEYPDVRNLEKRPTAPMAPMHRQPKRSRLDAAGAHGSPGPSSSYPPPPDPADSMMSTPRQTLPPPYATQGTPIQGADYDAVKSRKKQISDQMRAERAQHPTQQSRKPWSTKDQDILLACIYERQCRWAHIQEHDSDKFEVKRNQQAYRDKARNMKVDFLMTDAVLPPCFDSVALGKKEINRLIALGKNPYRKEADLNEANEPINVSYVPVDEAEMLRRQQDAEQERDQEQQMRDDMAVREQLDIQQQQHHHLEQPRMQEEERPVHEEERRSQQAQEAM